MPDQLTDWQTRSVEVPREALWNDFIDFNEGKPEEWGDQFTSHFGRLFCRIAFGPFPMHRVRRTAHHLKDYKQTTDFRIDCYRLPKHEVCMQIFYEYTAIQYPSLDIFQKHEIAKGMELI